MAKLQSADAFVIKRDSDGDHYSVTYKEVEESIVAAVPLTVGTPTLVGTAAVGETLTCSTGNGFAGLPPYTFQYSFLADGVEVQSGFTSPRYSASTTYVVQTSDLNKTLTAKIKCTDSNGDVVESVLSNPIGPIGVTGTINDPVVLAPDDGAGGGAITYAISDAITRVEDAGGGNTKLTLSGGKDLSDMAGSVLMTEGAGSGPYVQAAYKLQTSQIAHVGSGADVVTYDIRRVPSSYAERKGQTSSEMENAINTWAISNGNVWLKSTVLQQGIAVGEQANPRLDWESSKQLIYKFSEPVKATYSRISAWSDMLGKGTLWWLAGSNDGINWKVSAISDNKGSIPGPYPDNSNGGRRYADDEYEYYIFSYTWTEGFSNTDTYWLDSGNVAEEAILTFASLNPDLQYFRKGDVVQTEQLWDQSKMWSNDLTAPGWPSGDGPKLAFNGLLKTATGHYSGDTCAFPNGLGVWMNSDDIPFHKLVIHALAHEHNGFCAYPATTQCYVKVSNKALLASNQWIEVRGFVGEGMDFSFNQVGIATANDITTQVGALNGKFCAISFEANIARGWGLWGIEIDGRLLIDQDYSHDDGIYEVVSVDVPLNTMTVDGGNWLGADGSSSGSDPTLQETSVKYQTNGGQGTIVSVDELTKTMIVTPTGDRDNRWISQDNSGGNDFYVAGPQIIDAPLLTADVELESSVFATTPPGSDTLSEIVYDLNGTEQSAGTSYKFKPVLNTSTTYTCKVKHIGSSLGNSNWSRSITFTTGVTRSFNDYALQEYVAGRELPVQPPPLRPVGAELVYSPSPVLEESKNAEPTPKASKAKANRKRGRKSEDG